MQVEDNRIVKVLGDKSHPTNFGRLCTKGSTCGQAVDVQGRASKAHLRTARDRERQAVPIDFAISRAASALKSIIDTHGPDALAFYVSGQMSLESQYLANKLAKGFIGTKNVESNSRLCMASAASGYKLSLGADGPPGSYQDMDRADLFFVGGANMSDCHPILYLRMMDRVKGGAKLIVVDPRRTTTAEKASLFLQIRPGTDLALLNGILHLLVAQNRIDLDFIAGYTEGWAAMPGFLADYPPDRVAAITGIAEHDIRKAAEWIGEAPEWMSCWTMGLNQSTHGTWNTNAICNLHLATGKICRPGSGPFSLTGQPNAMGGREMGYMGQGLPGQRSSVSAEDRAFAEDLWGIPRGALRTEAGGGAVGIFEDMAAGKIKACWIICTNPAVTVANRKTVISGLQNAELVITQDAFLDTETNAYADIILPGALWSEAEGVMINSERNMTLMGKAVDPPGEALPDWQIISRIACEMGYGHAFGYQSASEVFEEIKRAWNPKTGYDIRGASYRRLSETPLQWPCGSETQSDRNPIRYLNDGVSQNLFTNAEGARPRIAFPTARGRAYFLPRPHMLSAEMPDGDFPLVLNTGRLQHQWHTLTKTGKVATLNKLNPGPFAEVHPDDAELLGIADGNSVQIRSRRGQAVLPAVVTDRVRPGTCFVPFHWNDAFGEQLAINEVTSDAVDPISLQPEFKFCAVALSFVAKSQKTIVEKAQPVAASGSAAGRMPALMLSAFGFAQETSVAIELMPAASIDDFSAILGVSDMGPPTFDDSERAYLSGFLTGMRSEQARNGGGVPVLPPGAPFDRAKALYIDGLLAGLFSRASVAAADMVAAASSMPEILILWASQTGNAEGIANRCEQTLKKAGHRTRVLCMEGAKLGDLAMAKQALFITSTFGDGDAPDNAAHFWKALLDDAAPALNHLQFAVLALGDSNYAQFCGFGRKLDGRLAEMRATRLADRVDCEPDYEDRVTAWLHQVVTSLGSKAPAAVVTAPASAAISRTNPLRTRQIRNQLLSGSGSLKEVRQFGFDLRDTGFVYAAGDALGVWPVNCSALVSEILAALDLPGSVPVTIKDKGEMSLCDALTNHYDIARITRGFLNFVRQHAEHAPFGEMLEEARKNDLNSWMFGRQIADVLREVPIRLEPLKFLEILKPLQPRLYSISSSPKVHVDEVQATVSTVRYSCAGKLRKGVCSTFLADRADGSPVSLFVQPSPHFKPPEDPNVPMIMVGPGTGVAPFRAFLEERQATGAPGMNWLFFGEQSRATDFYYRKEMESWLQQGHLTRLDLAFSRDQKQKIYVQDRMVEQGAELWRWLDRGASFFVCGDANRMAKDVDEALRKIVARHGDMSSETAQEYVSNMSKAKRYVRDVY